MLLYCRSTLYRFCPNAYNMNFPPQKVPSQDIKIHQALSTENHPARQQTADLEAGAGAFGHWLAAIS